MVVFYMSPFLLRLRHFSAVRPLFANTRPGQARSHFRARPVRRSVGSYFNVSVRLFIKTYVLHRGSELGKYSPKKERNPGVEARIYCTVVPTWENYFPFR